MKNLNCCKTLESYKRLSLFLFSIFCSCGYHFQSQIPDQEIPTISVPYIEGDDDGSLTEEIICALNASGSAKFSQADGQYWLKIAICAFNFETTGYRYDRQKISGKVKKNLVGSEARKFMTVEVTLYDGASDQPVLGPFQISEDVDYDFVDGDSLQDLAFLNSSSKPTIVLPFSLGQLESSEAAQEAATPALYRKIAQKLIDVITAKW